MIAPGAPAVRLALCNEVLQPRPFDEQCRVAAALGYQGLEVAPFTLADDPMQLSDAQAMAFARIAADHGLGISGLHWLLVAPAGLSISSADAAQRERTLAVMRRMTELCRLMGGQYLVHGSPKQRSVPAGSTHAQALDRATSCWAQAAVHARACGVVYCIEPLSTRETDVVNTVAQAAAIVQAVGDPALRTMIDCSAAGLTESEPVDALLHRWLPTGLIAHIQINDPNRRVAGMGSMNFAPILKALGEQQALGHYAGWVASEPFDYVPDGMAAAAFGAAYVKGLLEGLAS